MLETIAVQVPTLAEIAVAVRRCSEPKPAGEHSEAGGPALLVDSELRDGEPPREPGVYVWSDPHGAVLYIGRAAGVRWDLATRLGHERGLFEAYDPVGDWWEVSVIHLLRVHHARPRWVRARSTEAAKEAECRLIEYHRALVGIAPIAVGWDVDENTPKGRAQGWARALWDETDAGGPTDPRSR